MNLKEIGEFGFIERFKPWFNKLVPGNTAGIGDDCSVIPVNDTEDWVITTDLLTEGVHFLQEAITPWQLGYKALAVNLSDIAAMGAMPVGSFLSIAIPGEVTVEYLDDFMKGYLELSQKYNTPLLGGDTTKSLKHLAVNVCVVGKCSKGQAKMRNRAKENDVVCVTGYLGDSAGGLQVLLNHLIMTSDHNYLKMKHHLPEPRLDEGQYLAAMPGVHAMMDISDGIASDLTHILKTSDKSAEIDINRLPVSDVLRRVAKQQEWSHEDLAIAGGEDYELLCTIAPEHLQTTCDGFLSRFGKPLVPVGTIETGSPSIQWLKNGTKITLDKTGFNHFQ